jgi:hypothetical protein
LYLSRCVKSLTLTLFLASCTRRIRDSSNYWVSADVSVVDFFAITSFFSLRFNMSFRTSSMQLTKTDSNSLRSAIKFACSPFFFLCYYLSLDSISLRSWMTSM